MKRLLILIILSSPLASLGQIKKLDSLRQTLERHHQKDTIRFRLLITTSDYLLSSPSESKNYIEKALSLAIELEFKKGIAEAHASLANYFWNTMDYPQAINYGLIALRDYEHINNMQGLYDTYNMMAGIYVSLKDFERAQEYMGKVLKLGESNKNLVDYANVYFNLGFMNIRQNKFEDGIAFINKAMRIDNERNDQYMQATCYSLRAKAHQGLGHLNAALADYQSAIRAAKISNDPNALAVIAPAHEGIGSIFTSLKKFSNALLNLDTAMEAALQIKSTNMIIKIYGDKALLYEAQENFKEALAYERLRNVLSDSVFTNEKSKELTEAQTKYETEKKEQIIGLLEQENKVKSLSRNLLLISLTFVVVVSALIFYFQQLKGRRNKILNQKLLEADQLKSHFFASISHEFRTPLTLILSPVEEALKKPSITEEEEQPLLLMKRNANRLLELVNQLLDLSKLEAGKMKLLVKEHSIVQFLKVISASFDSWALYKQVRFIKNIQVTPLPICFDQDTLEKIITNLLSNAFKFTPAKGTVTLTISTKEKDGKTTLSIILADTGKGIPQDEQEHIFTPFYQIKQTSDGHQEGTGLGLSLVMELVKLYGGTLTLNSKLNEGTTFIVALPASKEQFLPEQLEDFIDNAEHNPSSVTKLYLADQEDQEHELPVDDKDTILIVEDNADLRNFLASILEPEFNILTARNGDEGVLLALSGVPNLVLSDLMMPKMDGIQLTKKIKTDERTSHIPVILLTAKNELESRLAGLKTGADDYLTKPFSNEELKVKIMNMISQRKKLAEKFNLKILVLPTTSEEQSLDEKFLHKARTVVEDNLSDYLFSVDRMAEEIGLSRTQLHRKMNAFTNTSPTEFIRDMRLNKAADLIRQKADTITQIGYRVGFKDQSYFAKCFKNKFGVAPSNYSEKIDSLNGVEFPKSL